MQTVTEDRYAAGLTYEEFRSTAQKHQGLWDGVYEHQTIPDDVLVRLHDLPGKRHILVLAEDWCGDAASLVPILAKLAHASPETVDFRILKRDENLDIMDQHLSHGGRAIPIAIVYDSKMLMLGWWGPRPAPAQAMFRARFRDFKAGRLKDKSEDVFKPLLKWYRQDRGRHTMDEILTILERGGDLRS